MNNHLSAVIITFNEEKNIERCLQSLQNIADEIIVVDSFSTDGTQQICQRFNVKFVQQKWQGYSQTKNFANNLASNKYILSLDADEALSEQLKNSISEAKNKGLKGVYSFNRLTNYCGTFVKHSGWYPDKKVRIFPKDSCRWEGDFVHETLFIPENLHETHLKGNLLHYSYYTTKEHLERIEKYSNLHAQKLLSEGKQPQLIKEIFSPAAKFIKTYFIQLGFLDGKAGFDIARLSAKAVYLKYKKLRTLYAQAS